ncbi:hypothetical protein ONZ43_g3190 [Nemania bipapillata]|uniref:Uncharacterized protein n=1 Tax=Nemania bipapillata TaxID=110536 RepID=A0ACC2IXY7_9PEZI|nr:hypothetical protein ONZ43_g3190 [Nemania bipapillata]
MDSSKSPTEQQQQSSTTRRRRIIVDQSLQSQIANQAHTSQSSGPSYESLMNYKRSNDPNSMARRSSLNEQKPQSGFFGSMWQNGTERVCQSMFHSATDEEVGINQQFAAVGH